MKKVIKKKSKRKINNLALQKKVKSNHFVIKKKKGFFESLFGHRDKKPINKPKNSIDISKSNEVILKKNKTSVIEKKELNNKKDKRESEFMRTGISGFDSLFKFKKGIPVGSSILIEGGPGSGKTIFCLSTLANLCKKNKKALYMSFEEPEERLLDHMESFGWPARKWSDQGLLRVKRFDALDVSRSIEALLSAAKKELLIDVDPVFFPRDFNPDFVVIDSLTSIASAFSGHENRFRIYMEQLFRYLEKNKITNFLIREVASPSHIGTTFKEEGEAVSFLSDGIIVLYNVIYNSGKRSSAIEILKMRGVDFEKKIIELSIKPKGGVFIYPSKILKRTSKSNFSLT